MVVDGRAHEVIAIDLGLVANAPSKSTAPVSWI